MGPGTECKGAKVQALVGPLSAATIFPARPLYSAAWSEWSRTESPMRRPGTPVSSDRPMHTRHLRTFSGALNCFFEKPAADLTTLQELHVLPPSTPAMEMASAMFSRYIYVFFVFSRYIKISG